MTSSIQGKVAVVTGAASGIGRAIAQALATAGARVVIADLNIEGAQAVSDQIAGDGGHAMAVSMDVTDEAAVEAGISAAVERFGPVDILVSNAGIQIVNPIENYAYADWKKMLAIHLDGAFLTTRAVLPHMYANAENGESRGGVVIYMGSVHSHQASPLKSAYVTAKHGLLGLARVLAKEGGKRGVRANVVCPGFVRTPLVEKQIPEQARELGIPEAEVISRVMLGQTVDGIFTTLEDVAQTVKFLCEFPSSALTGQSITVSHGWHMQ